MFCQKYRLKTASLRIGNKEKWTSPTPIAPKLIFKVPRDLGTLGPSCLTFCISRCSSISSQHQPLPVRQLVGWLHFQILVQLCSKIYREVRWTIGLHRFSERYDQLVSVLWILPWASLASQVLLVYPRLQISIQTQSTYSITMQHPSQTAFFQYNN